jgi:hypothetical protein
VRFWTLTFSLFGWAFGYLWAVKNQPLTTIYEYHTIMHISSRCTLADSAFAKNRTIKAIIKPPPPPKSLNVNLQKKLYSNWLFFSFSLNLGS